MVHFTGSDIVLFVIGFFLPPLEGCGADFLISVGLTLLGYGPGIAYAWWVIYTNREDPRTGRRVNGSGRPGQAQRRSYVTVASQPPPSGAPAPGVIHHYKVVQQGQPQQTSHTTTSTSTSGPVRTTTTTTTTKYVTPVDKKDANPPSY
ncbi:hypothetical protein BGZ58_005354 [Dissophora ornata]|nr:hypothetical protein BGZ58_005354 [Dissophora ornata]